jgi:hypothetical protein
MNYEITRNLQGVERISYPYLEAYERIATQQPNRRKKADRATPDFKYWGNLAPSRSSSA